jgi:hypothetical protein
MLVHVSYVQYYCTPGTMARKGARLQEATAQGSIPASTFVVPLPTPLSPNHYQTSGKLRVPRFRATAAVHRSPEFGAGPLVIKVALVMSDQLKTEVVILC